MRPRSDAPPAGTGRPVPTVVSVNVGLPRTVEWHGRSVVSAIWKEPVAGPIHAVGINLSGDRQADRRVHGGTDKAIYAYSVEDYEWWAPAIGHQPPGTFGENLTTVGIDLTGASIGDRWRVGSAVLEVAQPRLPCYKLGIRMSDAGFPDRFEAAKRPGAYLRIIVPGDIAAGDGVTVEPARRPAVTIGALVADDPDDELLRQIVADDRIPEGFRRAAARGLRRSS